MPLPTDKLDACFNHAKEHVLEAIRDVATEEHHSQIAFDGTGIDLAEKTQAREGVMVYIEAFISLTEKMNRHDLTPLILERKTKLEAALKYNQERSNDPDISAKRREDASMEVDDIQDQIDDMQAVIGD